MEDLTLAEMESTKGGFFNDNFSHNNVSIGNTATSVNVATVLGSGNFSLGGSAVLQSANSAAGNITNVRL